MINANGLQPNPLGGYLDTPSIAEIDGGDMNVQDTVKQAAEAAKSAISAQVSEAKSKIEQAATQAKSTITSNAKAATNASATADIDPAYKSPVAIGAGLAGGIGTAVAVYNHREGSGKKGIIVPALAGVVADTAIHFVTAKIIQHSR